MCPLARSWTNDDGSFFERGNLCGHCLLIETERDGLVLVDTGFGEDGSHDRKR